MLVVLPTLAQFPSTDSAYFFLFGNSGVEEFKDVSNHSIDSGYVMVGSTSSFTNGTSDLYLVKTDWKGNTIWSRHFGGEGIENGTSVVETPDHGFLVGGFTNTTPGGDYDFYTVKCDSQGFAEWSKNYGGSDWDFLRSVAIASDSGYFFCGETYSFGNAGSDIYLIRTNKNGDTLWTKTYGGLNNQAPRKIIFTTDSSLVIVGYTENNTNGMKDLYLIKCNSANGDTIFTRMAGGTFNDVANAVVEHNSFDYGYVIVGYTESFNLNHDKDIWVIKYDSSGNLMWQSSFGNSSGDDEATCIAKEGYDFFVSGYTPNGAGEQDLVAGILNFGGFWLWNQSTSYGSYNSDFAWANTKTLRGDYLFAGSTNSFNAHSTDALLLLTDSIKVQFQSVTTSSDELVGISNTVIADLNIFPNPAIDRIFFSGLKKLKNIRYQLFDAEGRLVVQSRIENVVDIESIDISNFAGGVYYLDINADQICFRKKLIVLPR